jgi:hypothetical protein
MAEHRVNQVQAKIFRYRSFMTNLNRASSDVLAKREAWRLRGILRYFDVSSTSSLV